MSGAGGRGMDAARIRAWMTENARLVEQEKDRLTELDAAIGDSDHGINVERGYSAAVAAIGSGAPATPGAAATLVGNTLVSKVGGASGPLLGTVFRRLGKTLGDTPDADGELFGAALQAGLEGVCALGGAKAGDKTMVDAFAPAVAAFRAQVEEGGPLVTAAEAAASAARKGADTTVGLQALKGRASYLGPRSIGHEDPGAASTVLLFAALATALASD